MPVHTCVAGCARNGGYIIVPLGGILFEDVPGPLMEYYVPCIYWHARWSYSVVVSLVWRALLTPVVVDSTAKNCIGLFTYSAFDHCRLSSLIC